MRALGYQVVDTLVEHFHEMGRGAPGKRLTRPELESRFREPPPESGMEPLELVRVATQAVFDSSLHVDHPRFFAFVPSPGNFVSTMADALASGFTPFVGNWFSGSGPTEIELVTVDWLRELCGFPESAAGLFVSGGSMANLTGLAAATRAKLGYETGEAVVYFSDQTHSCVPRALSVLGFTPAQIRRIPSDSDFRLPLEALAAEVGRDRSLGRRPFCVVANAGATNTGAVDPLAKLAAFCRTEDLWFHVDGAYGAAAVISAEGRRLLGGIEQADSLALDPHKWLFQPYEIGCVLVRDGGKLKETFRITAEYMQDFHKLPEVNLCDYGIQLTRGFRALKLWMSLKTFGLAAFRQALERGFRLAETAERRLRKCPQWEIVTPAQMGIVTFRWAASDEANQRLVGQLLADGYAVLSSTVLRGRTVLRMCPINPRTTEDEISETIARLEKLASGQES